MLAPRWKHTPMLSLVAPLLLALVYTLLFVSELFLIPKGPDEAPPDFLTLTGVMTVFADPTNALGCWVHYCAYDPLIGRWMVMDSIERGASIKFHILVMLPLLTMALLMGPMGWLAYMVVAAPLLSMSGTDAKKKVG
ncbi:expressed unknown protein [Seminavis robusta]|uniref:DUF4281 domain-containing protein n=1 Tax=Seminavis robusta TaxID=568900 RepID=A0A9N8EUW5_9STRA|nr:expressed unknown protein [Seminavis robusta]|eukprot:Sro1639_g287840.1 n/a (137) ;mRNA; f:17528-17938